MQKSSSLVGLWLTTVCWEIMAKPHGLIDRIGNENFDAGGLLVSPNMLDKVLKCFKRTAAQTIPRRGLHTMHGYFFN